MGSGKGYLSEHLARTCDVLVVGLDSQASNTEGAIKRSKKVYFARVLLKLNVIGCH